MSVPIFMLLSLTEQFQLILHQSPRLYGIRGVKLLTLLGLMNLMKKRDCVYLFLSVLMALPHFICVMF